MTTTRATDDSPRPGRLPVRLRRPRLRAVLLAGAALSIWAAAAAAGPAAMPARADLQEQETEKKRTVDSEAVYFGDAREWTKPAELDAEAVYREIAEYKEIQDGKIEPSDAKYDVLMAKARKRFLQAIRCVAKDAGYDLVARLGSVRGVEGVPNITRDVIAKL